MAAKNYSNKMEERYNFIRVLGMDKPIPLRDVYVKVNILDKINSRQRLTLDDLEKMFDRDQRSFGTTRKTISGTDAINSLQKFIVLGKPGAGKTTFLKFLVLQTLDGNIRNKRIPIFIGLKDFSDSGKKTLLSYIVEQFDVCRFPDAEPFIIRILEKGKCLLLLDGLDEVNKADEKKIIREILIFSEKFSENQFVLSCRIAAYNHWFNKFTDVEMSDFNNDQIEVFIYNWFGNKEIIAQKCWEKLREDKHIREIASTPILLTLLCLAFEQIMDFPKNRSELYKEALDTLLKKWDGSRYIKRDEIYKHLSLKRKETLFGRIAFEAFEKGNYFLKQQFLENRIADFIKHLPNADEDSLLLDSEVVLKAIEAQHGIFVERAKGIYSFSHLTFQEYYTAKYIIDNINRDHLGLYVEKYLINDQWREVFLLISGMLEEADDFLFLIKDRIDNLIQENGVKELLVIIRDKSKKTAPYPIAFDRALIILKSVIKATKSSLDNMLEVQLTRLLLLELYHSVSSNLTSTLSLASNTDRARMRNLQRNLKRVSSDSEYIESESDYIVQDILRYDIVDFLKSNILLLECMNSECYIKKETREKILNSILTI